jgi:two-component system sensor histidine kinase/response regulator
MSLYGKMEAIQCLGGNESLYNKYMERFETKYRDCVPKLIEQMECMQYEEAYRYAHSIKGLSSLLGLPTIQLYAEAIETAIKEGRYLDLPPLFHSMQFTLNQILGSAKVQSSSSVGT